MLFSSPHPDLHLPPEGTILPRFLLNVSRNERTSSPLLYPVPEGSPFSSNRPKAKVMSLYDIRERAYKTAKAINDGAFNQSSRTFQRGDVVAIYSANQHDYLAIVLGIQLVGGVPALCNPSYKSTELAHQFRMTRTRCVITTSGSPGGDAANNPLEKAKEAIRLACSEADTQEAGGFAKLEEAPTLYLFEEGQEQSLSNKFATYDLTEEAIERINEQSKQVESDDAAVLCFSSGTSGLPKAVILTHRNLVSNTVQASFLLHDRMNEPLFDGREYSKDGKIGWYDTALPRGAGSDVSAVQGQDKVESLNGLAQGGHSMAEMIDHAVTSFRKMLHLDVGRGKETGKDRILSRPDGQHEFHIDILPQFHCYGLLVNLVALHTCTPRIIMPRFHLETFLQCVSKHGVTFCFVVPPILLALAKHPMVDQYDVSTLWRVASGAASLPDEIALAVGKRLGIRCTDGYGMTEMSPIISMQTIVDIEQAPNTVGVLTPKTQALVLDENNEECQPGQPGELLLRGPQMMKGYLENDKANESAFYLRRGEDGSEVKWLRTGDVVKIDDRGYITITDRIKDVIKAKGFQVSPAELEAVLFKDDRVADVAVTARRNQGAETPWAFVVPHGSAFGKDAKESQDRDAVAKSILKKANEQMAGYKKIEGLTWLEALPKSDSGKVLKKELKMD